MNKNRKDGRRGRVGSVAAPPMAPSHVVPVLAPARAFAQPPCPTPRTTASRRGSGRRRRRASLSTFTAFRSSRPTKSVRLMGSGGRCCSAACARRLSFSTGGVADFCLWRVLRTGALAETLRRGQAAHGDDEELAQVPAVLMGVTAACRGGEAGTISDLMFSNSVKGFFSVDQVHRAWKCERRPRGRLLDRAASARVPHSLCSTRACQHAVVSLKEDRG